MSETAREQMGLHAWGHRVAHRIFDFAVGVRPGEVLNPHPHDGPALDAVLPALRSFLHRGKVDYAALREAPEFMRLCAAAGALHDARPPSARPAARAWWINLYNGLIIHAVIAFGIRRTVREDWGFFRRAAYIIGGNRVSTDDIEHGILRGNLRHPLLQLRQFGPDDPRQQWSLPLDPRVHFALVCASRSCPAIGLYTAADLEAQLELATSGFVAGGGVRLDPDTGTLYLSSIFRWYQRDFGGRDGTLSFIARHVDDPVAHVLLSAPRVRVRYVNYDWTLNAARARRGGIRSGVAPPTVPAVVICYPESDAPIRCVVSHSAGGSCRHVVSPEAAASSHGTEVIGVQP